MSDVLHAITTLVLGFVMWFVAMAVWVTGLVSLGFHVFACIDQERWVFLIVGVAFMPIGIIHGFILLMERMF